MTSLPDFMTTQNYTKPDFSRCALLTIDTQNDFTLPGAPAEIEGTIDVVPKMERIVKAFRAKQRPIVHVVRLYLSDGSNADLCRKDAIECGERIVTPASDGAACILHQITPNQRGELRL